MSKLKSHAQRELELAGWYEKDSVYGGMIPEAVLELMEVFSKQGHSGGSAPIVISLFKKLAMWEAISPLTGEDAEWNEVSEGVFQNNRQSTVFKQADRFNGQAYTIEGKVFSDNGGLSWFTNSNSFVPIEFPYTHKEPERVIIK